MDKYVYAGTIAVYPVLFRMDLSEYISIYLMHSLILELARSSYLGLVLLKEIIDTRCKLSNQSNKLCVEDKPERQHSVESYDAKKKAWVRVQI